MFSAAVGPVGQIGLAEEVGDAVCSFKNEKDFVLLQSEVLKATSFPFSPFRFGKIGNVSTSG